MISFRVEGYFLLHVNHSLLGESTTIGNDYTYMYMYVFHLPIV